jgi:peptide/nickel transport system substrate-binding protein
VEELKMKRRTLIFVAVLFTASLILSACQSGGSGSLTVLIGSDEGLLTPVDYNTDTGYWMLGWVYDSLFTLGPDLTPTPSLATSATSSADGLTWQISLRNDARWHDGQPFTAQDVIFTYQYLMDSGHGKNLSVIDTMEARGDFALTITLSQPYAFFIGDVLAHYYIMPQHIWKGQQADFQGMIGTGAYELTEVVPGKSYTFEANPAYFRGQPQVSSIVA